MQSLLSPAESHAFQSFLSNMDFADDSITPSEWAIYNSQGQTYHNHDDPSQNTDSNLEHREALTKATKDLMSLDTDGWDGGGAMTNHNSGSMSQSYDARGQYDQQQQDHRFSHQQHVMHQEQRLQHMQQEHQRQSPFSSGSDLFPFLHNKTHQQPSTQELRYPMQHQHGQHHPHLNMSSMHTSNSDHGSPTTSSHPFSGFQQHDSRTISLRRQHSQRQNQPRQVLIPSHPDQQRGISPTSGPATRSKRQPTRSSSSLARSESASPPHSTSDPNSNVASTSSNSIRSNLSINGNAKRARSATSPSISSSNPSLLLQQQQQPTSNPKQALLSPSQKKANHIQSEQKRRANIRRGYEALCETVPALREAIREEEEAERNAANGQRGGGNAAQRKKSRGKKGSKDSEEKDRLDGRAGPRSENVVLSKTIDHIQALIADRSALLARLHRARSSLPPGHPALMSLVTDPSWEREWKGGNGRLGDEDPEGDCGSDGEEDEDGE